MLNGLKHLSPLVEVRGCCEGYLSGENPARILKYRNMKKYEDLKLGGMFYLRLKAEGKMKWGHIVEK